MSLIDAMNNISKLPLVMRLNYFFVIICLLFTLPICGQTDLPDSNRIDISHKWKENQLMIRWNPAHPALWEHGLKVGYVVEKYRYPSAEGADLALIEESDVIFPSSYEDWNGKIQGVEEEMLLGIRDFIHFDRVDPALIEEDLPSSEYSDYGRLNLRYQLSNYIMHQHFDIVQMAGQGITYEQLNAKEKYRFIVRFASPHPTYAVQPAVLNFQASQYQPPNVPTLEAEYNPRYVDFKWRTKDYRQVYYGYFLEKSENGRDFELLFEEPTMNIYDTTETIEAFKYAYSRDSLAENNKQYTYRLRGGDFFGELSEEYSEIAGEGYDPIPYSPIIVDAIQTDSNYAIINWQFPEEYEDLVKEFQLYHADTLGGIFKVAQVGIGKALRTASIFMTASVNYYRVVAKPYKGPNKGSFSALVMAWDSEPPAAPLGLEGTIDSNGVVKLHWLANAEKDLDGYKVYKSYVKDAEFSGITPRPFKETYFQDTVSMTLGNEFAYYKIQSVDKRNNRSEFTEILTLKKVDVYPPVEPHIYDVTKGKDQIELKWHNSSSADVVRHRLFRRAMNEEQSWTLLADYALGEERGTYVDSTLEQGKLYVYTLTAIDDDGLESAPAQPASAKLIGAPRQGFEMIETEISDEKSLKITWLYPEQAQKYWIYKGTEDQQLALFKVLKADRDFIVDANLKPGGTYHYYLRAVLEDGSFSPFSQKIEVSIPAD